MSRVDAGLSEFILQEHRKKVNIRGIWFMGISFDDPVGSDDVFHCINLFLDLVVAG